MSRALHTGRQRQVGEFSALGSDRAWIVAVGALWLLLSVLPGRVALANGGLIQLSGEPAGPYALTVTTSPSPIRTGDVDVSVFIELVDSRALVQDARVIVTAEPLGHAGPSGVFEASRERATNKLFQAADVRAPTAGRWRIGVLVSGPLGDGGTAFEVEVLEPSLLDRLVPLPLLLAAAVATATVIWWRARSLSRAGGGC